MEEWSLTALPNIYEVVRQFIQSYDFYYDFRHIKTWGHARTFFLAFAFYARLSNIVCQSRNKLIDKVSLFTSISLHDIICQFWLSKLS